MNWRITISCALTLAIVLPLTSQAAPKVKRKASSSSAFGVDPNAKKVDLFKAIDDKQVKVALTVQARATGVLTLTNVSDQPLTVEVPLTLGANPDAPPGAVQAYYATAFGTSGAPQSLAVAVSPQWTAGVEKKSGRKSNVKTKKKTDEEAKDEKKGDEKDAKEKDAKKEETKSDSLVATVPLPAGATQNLPLFTLGLNMKRPQATYGQFIPADLEKVTQAPEMKKVLEHLAQNHITEDVAQTLAWHYNDRMTWEEMQQTLLVTPIQIQLAQQAAEVVEGRASPEAATTTTTGKKKK
ncbi:MAG TPA: hypothetical protein VFI31_14710 [Pirellulales bacterium]|nr:hypothetical protein [Pirellulales bacterium]